MLIRCRAVYLLCRSFEIRDPWPDMEVVLRLRNPTTDQDTICTIRCMDHSESRYRINEHIIDSNELR